VAPIRTAERPARAPDSASTPACEEREAHDGLLVQGERERGADGTLRWLCLFEELMEASLLPSRQRVVDSRTALSCTAWTAGGGDATVTGALAATALTSNGSG
jgi:predicted phage gp36 major capsid-like protein